MFDEKKRRHRARRILFGFEIVFQQFYYNIIIFLSVSLSLHRLRTLTLFYTRMSNYILKPIDYYYYFLFSERIKIRFVLHNVVRTRYNILRTNTPLCFFFSF